jgi:Zn-dependent protease
MRSRERWIPLGRFWGIPVGLDYSWFLIFALLTWSLGGQYFPAHYSGWSNTLYWVIGALTSLALFASVLLHEFGHALLARIYHIPVLRIRLMIFGGVAELGDDAPNATGEFLVAIAGPIVSFLLAAGMGLAWFGLRLGGIAEPLMALLGYLALINLTLAVFNLIPGFPLDGGRVLRSVIWGITDSERRATLIAARIGRFVGLAFIGLGVVQALTMGVVGGLWTAFIGMFLQSAAAAEVQTQHMRDLLRGRTVSQVMRRNTPVIPADLPVEQVVMAQVLGRGTRTFVVTENGAVVGLLTTNDVYRHRRDQWQGLTVGDVMTRLNSTEQIRPDTELWAALRQMEAGRVGQLPVVEDGLLAGLLRRDDLFRFLNTLRMAGPEPVRI